MSSFHLFTDYFYPPAFKNLINIDKHRLITVFVDELVYYLFVLAFAGFLLAYMMSEMYLAYRKGKMDIHARLESLSVPLIFLGGYLLVTGVIS